MILPKQRDPRLITIRRGGTLTDEHHRLLALWAAKCSDHVLPFFEDERPDDDRPRRALNLIRAWSRGEATMRECQRASFASNAAAHGVVSGAARLAALSAGQAVAVAHVAAHDLGAAAYAIRAARDAAGGDQEEDAGRRECQWQRDQLPEEIRVLVLDDQRVRNEICWSVFASVVARRADSVATPR